MKLVGAKRPDRLKKSVQLRFGGYNALGTEGELCDMENMTSEFYPELASRPRRRHMTDVAAPRGMGAGDALYWADGRSLVYDGTRYENALADTEAARRFAQLGDILTIWPDKLAFDTGAGTITPLEHIAGRVPRYLRSYTGTYSSRGNMLYTYLHDQDKDTAFRVGDAVRITGNIAYPENNVTAVIRELTPEPEGTPVGWGLIFDDDTFVLPNHVRLITAAAIEAGTYYVDVGCSDCGLILRELPALPADSSIYVKFRQGTGLTFAFDAVREVFVYRTEKTVRFDRAPAGLTEETLAAGLAGTAYADALWLDCAQQRTVENRGIGLYAWAEYLGIRREAPDLDIVFTHDNRLFGAKDDALYVSKWGDPLNWNVFDGLASDSFATETGTPGAFTGGISFGGYPRFFKEDYIFTLYGDYPAEYQIKQQRQPGVSEGSDASLAEGGGRLFYLSQQGPCAFSGGEPSLLAEPFGVTRYHGGVGAADDRRYYLAMEDENGGAHQFAYDLRRGLWMREDGVKALAMCRYRGEVLRLDDAGSVDVLGRATRNTGAGEEDAVEWFAEFGDIAWGLPGKKRITKLMLRLALEEGSAVRVRLRFDGERDLSLIHI